MNLKMVVVCVKYELKDDNTKLQIIERKYDYECWKNKNKSTCRRWTRV